MEELKLDRSTKFLVVSIENISKSRLNQLEEWKQLDNPNKSSVDRLNRKIITEVNLNMMKIMMKVEDLAGLILKILTNYIWRTFQPKKLLKLMKMNHCGFYVQRIQALLYR